MSIGVLEAETRIQTIARISIFRKKMLLFVSGGGDQTKTGTRSPPRSSRGGVGGGALRGRHETRRSGAAPPLALPARGGEGTPTRRLDQSSAPLHELAKEPADHDRSQSTSARRSRGVRTIACAEAGEEIVIARDNAPVALLSRLPRADDIRAAIEEIRHACAGLPATVSTKSCNGATRDAGSDGVCRRLLSWPPPHSPR